LHTALGDPAPHAMLLRVIATGIHPIDVKRP
jgi:hypothetical protein